MKFDFGPKGNHANDGRHATGAVLGLDGYFKADPASKASNLLRKIFEDFGERLD